MLAYLDGGDGTSGRSGPSPARIGGVFAVKKTVKGNLLCFHKKYFQGESN
jgi:hypothetical protein